jgi:hypothetical protein
MDRRRFTQLAAAATVAGGASPVTAVPAPGLTEESIAAAWLATLPLIEAAAARARMTDPHARIRMAGLNAFVHARMLVNARFRAITTPNNDTLYSQAFVDLTRGPVTLTIPDVGARYQSVAVMADAFRCARTPSNRSFSHAFLLAASYSLSVTQMHLRSIPRTNSWEPIKGRTYFGGTACPSIAVVASSASSNK